MCRKLARCGLSAVLCPLAVIPSAGLADEPPASMFTFGGFGTLGVVHSDQPLADFTSAAVEGEGAGHTHPWSVAVDSLLAAQVGARITPQLSAVLQVMSEQNPDSSFTPHVEWAYVQYQFTPDVSVRVGRTPLDAFLLTDSRNLGFAYPWVRPPIELYDLVPETNSDGVDFSYRLPVLGGSNTIDASIGHAHYEYPIPNSRATGDADATQQFTMVDTFQRGSASLRLTYGRRTSPFPSSNPCSTLFANLAPRASALRTTTTSTSASSGSTVLAPL